MVFFSSLRIYPFFYMYKAERKDKLNYCAVQTIGLGLKDLFVGLSVGVVLAQAPQMIL